MVNNNHRTFPVHPVIRRGIFADLQKKASTIDNALSLHYASHSTDPLITEILDSASSLAQMKIKILDIQVIYSINPCFYHIYDAGNNPFDSSNIYISFPLGSKNSLMDKRKIQFNESIGSWIQNNQEVKELTITSMKEILDFNDKLDDKTTRSSSTSSPSPTKVSKLPRSNSNSPVKRNLLKELKNEAAKFQFKQKDALKEQLNNNGLTLIERIRLKEKLRNEIKNPFEDAQSNYDNYLTQKSASIYEVIFQLFTEKLESEPFKLFSVSKLCQTVKDSSDYPLDIDEILDILRVMEQKLSKNKFSIVNRNGLSVLKVSNLNRNSDLQLINQ
ncbi:hypothetical protein DFJ63DRAFT_90112 [Scheffersomyces coipomensis]|uniref:uncharacterized protein n=1 Tax=Scheffersomyces coipomensis TaxID=1788519 RepID=UPI00315DBF50